MTDSLAGLVSDLSAALKAVDERRPVGRDQRFKPGIGPLTETELTVALIAELGGRDPAGYAECGARGYPGSRAVCDLVLPGRWAVEIKLARPFGDNGKPAERWSENLLYPYPGNTSSIGDCLKLVNSSFTERRAVVVIGYEHAPAKIALEPAVRSFELIAREVCGIALSQRVQSSVERLVHPHHQRAEVYGWEVSSALETVR